MSPARRCMSTVAATWLDAVSAAHTVFAGARLRATLFDPGQPRLAVLFDHLEPKRRGFSEAVPSRSFARRGFSQLLVQTARNDWYLNDDLAPLANVLGGLCRGHDAALAVGFSMGGFAALKLSRVIGLNRVLLVSAQVTPFADRPPYDPRYRRHAAGLDAALDLDPADIAPGLSGLALFDPLNRTRDRDHARAIAALAPGVRAVAMPFGGHPATGLIRRAGLWGHLQRLVAEDRLEPAPMVALRRRARGGSLDYAQRLGDRLVARGADPAAPKQA